MVKGKGGKETSRSLRLAQQEIRDNQKKKEPKSQTYEIHKIVWKFK
jgi:hypothetical protein